MDILIAVLILIFVFAAGFFLGQSFRFNKNYDGYLDISEQDASKIHQLEITTDPDDLKEKKFIVFEVRKIPIEEKTNKVAE